jgi:hypothetical protein
MSSTGPQTAAQWREFLASASTNKIAAIRAFLRSGKDASTGRGFRLNADGTLREAPTLRTMLLDALGKLSPQEAAEEARDILKSKTSPDEWAVCLALCARADNSPATLDFLQQKAEELALCPAWQQNPSAGFLEAFDLFVYTQDTDFIPQLSQFLGARDNPALAHAAFLTLDRLVQSAPADCLEMFLDNPGLLSGRPQTEADFFARADPSDPEQAALLEEYLLAANRSAAALEAFAGVFPNENFMISDNLLTPCGPVSNAEILSRYQSAQQTLESWMNQQQFAAIKPQLQQSLSRISRILGGFSAVSP